MIQLRKLQLGNIICSLVSVKLDPIHKCEYAFHLNHIVYR